LADEISDLRLFVRMVAAGSLAETARRLNSSLPAMSRRLAMMEARLGVRLIDRSSRRFSVTEEGGLLYERGISLIKELDEAEAEVSAKVKTPRGHLRVGTLVHIGRRRLAPLVSEFVKLYPEISVELVLSDSRRDVADDELDIGIQLDEPTDGNVVARALLTSRRVACASPDYVARFGLPERPDDLSKHNCILLVRGRRVFDRWLFQEGGRRREIQVSGGLLSNSAEVTYGWTLAGEGIGLKALWDIEDDLRTGRLVEVLAPYACDEIKLYVTYATRSHLPLRMRVFIDFIAAALKQTVGADANVPRRARPDAA
jgi:DNA-binding transcriptional LysR family regulator